jgi:hypothetical protein
MKHIFTLVISCLLLLTASSQQWKLITHYNLGAPQCDMGKNIQATHGLQAGVLYQLPAQFKKFSVGLELGVGTYAHKQVEQTFEFNGHPSVVPVNYNSNTFNVNLQARYNLLDEKRFLVVPYINAKAGLYNFYSNVTIEDPHDADGCQALERKNIINDKTFYYSAGGGVQINPSVFSKHKRPGRVMIVLSANATRGGKLDYINTKNLMDAQDVPQPGGKPLNVRFVEASTQSIHEHSVAQVHTSSLRMLEFGAGVILNLGKCKSFCRKAAHSGN